MIYQNNHMANLCLLLVFSVFCSISAKIQTAPSYSAESVAKVNSPRGLFVDTSGDILVVSKTDSTIQVLYEGDDDTFTKILVVDGRSLGLTHGLAYHGGYIYASSPSAVYRWPYVAGSRTKVTVDREVVVQGIPSEGYSTRTIIFDTSGRLLVSIGSVSISDVDPNSERARIWRFELKNSAFPIDFSQGELFADGVRNSVGLTFDEDGFLWGVDNGAEHPYRPDLGGDLNIGNPAEELNRYHSNGNYGYPYCFSSDRLQTYSKGTQFAWQNFVDDGVHTDEWCQNTNNNIPPVLALPAHWAPLGIEFHAGQGCGGSKVKGAFPCDMIGDALVTSHGSSVVDTKVGYKVSRVQFSKTGNHLPTGEIVDIIYEADLKSCNTCFRPVDVVLNHKGHLFVSDDENNQIVRVIYIENEENASNQNQLEIGVVLVSSIFILFQFHL